MTTILKSLKTSLFLAACFALYAPLKAQKNDSAAINGDIADLIHRREFVFVPQSATSQNGRTRQLTSEYFLKISADTIESSLPFFGVAYAAPIDPSSSGIDFITRDFIYSEKPQKKGGWMISIRFKNQESASLANLSVSASGWATLTVNANNRQSMSFYGYITAKTR